MAYNILMVDDEPLVLAGYRRVLSSYFNVHTAASPEDGLRLLNNNDTYAAVVVDYVMPETDGIEFLSRARQSVPATVRIMLTGKGDLQVAADAVNRGNVYFYLTKPCPGEKLLEAVITAVEVFRCADRDLIISELEPERLEGLKDLYSGIVALEDGQFEEAVISFVRARSIFQQKAFTADLARIDLFLAGALLRTDIEKTAPDQSFEPAELINEAFTIIEESVIFPFSRPDGDYLGPSFDWVLENGIKPPAVVNELLDRLDRRVGVKPVLQISALGPLQIRADNKVIEESDWRNPKAKLVFLYLLTNRRKKNEIDVMVEHFWPGMASDKAINNFSSCLYTIRQVVGTEPVSYRSGHCWLTEGCYSCDADDFAFAVNKGRSNYLDNRDSEAAYAFENALALYRGKYLEEYSYHDWISTERERLATLLVAMLIELAEIYACREQYGLAAETLEKVPLLEVYEDRLLYSLISYYLQAGKKGLAFRRYNHHRSRLSDELGLEPDPQIGKLFQ
jgi:DNA-binding SARP family transcriptional activator/CheY-like chemotaxis protein